jgi:hypothetical protein
VRNAVPQRKDKHRGVKRSRRKDEHLPSTARYTGMPTTAGGVGDAEPDRDADPLELGVTDADRLRLAVTDVEGVAVGDGCEEADWDVDELGFAPSDHVDVEVAEPVPVAVPVALLVAERVVDGVRDTDAVWLTEPVRDREGDALDVSDGVEDCDSDTDSEADALEDVDLEGLGDSLRTGSQTEEPGDAY